jgi:hypothetical protein
MKIAVAAAKYCKKSLSPSFQPVNIIHTDEGHINP